MSVTVRVEGLDALNRKLRRLDRAQVKDLAQGPVHGAGVIVERAIAAKAPRGTEPLRPGAVRLAESVETVDVKDSEDAAVRVGPHDFTALFLEYGWTHVGGGEVPARPFIRPAYQGSKRDAQKHAVGGIIKAIERRAPYL